MTVCDERCSHNQTPDTLRALGYDVPELRRDAHALDIGLWQGIISRLTYQAFIEGHVKICTRTERIVAYEDSLKKGEQRAKRRK